MISTAEFIFSDIDMYDDAPQYNSLWFQYDIVNHKNSIISLNGIISNSEIDLLDQKNDEWFYQESSKICS